MANKHGLLFLISAWWKQVMTNKEHILTNEATHEQRNTKLTRITKQLSQPLHDQHKHTKTNSSSIKQIHHMTNKNTQSTHILHDNTNCNIQHPYPPLHDELAVAGVILPVESRREPLVEVRSNDQHQDHHHPRHYHHRHHVHRLQEHVHGCGGGSGSLCCGDSFSPYYCLCSWDFFNTVESLLFFYCFKL